MEVSSDWGCPVLVVPRRVFWPFFFPFLKFPAANVPMSGSMQPHSRIPPDVLWPLADLSLRVFRETLLFTAGSTGPPALQSPLRGETARHVHKMALPVRRTSSAGYCGSNKERKQAHIIITISANCGDGSVTVSVDMLHIVSITPKLLFQTMP